MSYDILGDDILGDDILGDDGSDGDDILGASDLVGDDLAIAGLTGADLMGLSTRQKLALAAGGAGLAGAGFLAYKLAARRKAAQNRLAAGAIMNKRVGNSPVLAIRKPTKGREQPLNFFQTVIAGTTVNVTTRPQTLFRGGRVILPESSHAAAGGFVANPFQVQDIVVGRNSQFVARQPMPAAAFFQNAFGVRIQADTGQISQDVTFVVTNRAAVDVDFEATIIGESVE